jgi:hypothetical protein
MLEIHVHFPARIAMNQLGAMPPLLLAEAVLPIFLYKG